MAAINIEQKGEILADYFTDGKILDSQRIEQVGRELQEGSADHSQKDLLTFVASALCRLP